MFALISTMSNMTSNGIKFNGQNYNDWIEYVKLNAGLLGLDSALVMDEPTKPTDTSSEASSEADKKLWQNWERSNRLMMSFLKLSIAPNVKPSQPKTENVREFVAEIKKCTMIDIMDKSVVVALIDDLSNREYTIAQSMDEHITHMVNIYNQLKGLDMDLGERVLVEFMLKSCKGDDFKQFRRTYNQLKEKWSLSDTKAMLMQEEARQREELKVKLPQANFVYHGNSNAGSSGGKAPSKKWKNKGKQLFKVQPAEVRIYNPNEKKLDSKTISGYFIGYPERSKEYRFYCPNHSTRIVVSENARFIENGKARGSVGARDVEIRESLMDKNPSSDLSQVDVHIIVAQPQGMNMEQQQMDASNPIMDAIVQEDEENAQSGKQSVIATSTMEVEFVACFEATVQSLWLCNFVDGLGIIDTIAKPMRIYCDNATAVFFSKNDRYSKGAKHMDLKYLSVKDGGAKSKSSNSAHWHQ
ncbi:hypothetical protein V6N11_080102 [Hibiscus sabdariffa]|uniref:Retroviral polymerase SH3-like domain-containing protein n=1 Tax=Hibiscus sabdariffa TaxID=183260 RepID=A0ABR2RXD1_9ROSI